MSRSSALSSTLKLGMTPVRSDRGYRYQLANELGPILTVEFRPISMISHTVYVWMELHQRPRLRDLRKLKHQWDTMVNLTCYCNVQVGNIPALHFAEFFGFEPVEVNNNIIVMERPV